MMHSEPSSLAGKAVRIKQGMLSGKQILVEDWWDRIVGKSWMACNGNPACLEYALRERTPIDDEVINGKIGSFGALVHVTFLAEVEAE